MYDKEQALADAHHRKLEMEEKKLELQREKNNGKKEAMEAAMKKQREEHGTRQ